MRVNIYIRKGDVEKWKALENKSEFIHNALSGKELYVQESPSEALVVGLNEKGDYVTANKARTIPKVSTNYCKNGHPVPEGRSKCLDKGCKYGQ